MRQRHSSVLTDGSGTRLMPPDKLHFVDDFLWLLSEIYSLCASCFCLD